MSEAGRGDELGKAIATGGLQTFLAWLLWTGDPITGVAATIAQVMAIFAYDSIFRRGEPWLSTFRRQLMESHGEEEFEAEVRARAADPEFRNTIFQSFRQLRDAMSDSVAPALGALAAEYTIPKLRPVDAFFRSMGDTLSDVSEAEYQGLCTIVTRMASLDPKEAERCYIGTVAERITELAVAVSEPIASVARDSARLEELDGPGGRRLVAVMLRNGLLEDVRGGPISVAGFDVMASADRETVERMNARERVIVVRLGVAPKLAFMQPFGCVAWAERA
jgi:hypothetical protein